MHNVLKVTVPPEQLALPPNADICDACGEVYYVGQWYQCPHDWVHGVDAQRCLPMVFYRNPATGETQTPPTATDARAHAYLTDHGYERVEMRPGRQYDRWQKDERTRIAVEREQLHERWEKAEGVEHAANRAQLRHEMQTMSREGRAYAERAMERSEARADERRKAYQREAVPLVHAMEWNSSNMPDR